MHWNFWSAKRAPKASRKDSPLVEYRIGRRFDPGAEAEVFEQVFTNPVILFRGPGTLAGALAVFQTPQVWISPAIGVQGLGGVQAGQYVGQPLVDPAQFDISDGQNGS